MTWWMILLGFIAYMVIGGVVCLVIGLDTDDLEGVTVCSIFWPIVAGVCLVFLIVVIPFYTAKFLKFCGRFIKAAFKRRKGD